ncbi:MAG TPA: hypothetical protein EYP14_00725, partial [Planctomycetaceae bacterium]|nr:hypothetical protein [Planctomycetaceae bacterium]
MRHRRLLCEPLEQRQLLSLVNPFDEVDFDSDAGRAVRGLVERVAAGLPGDAGIVKFDDLRNTMEDYLRGVEVDLSSAVEFTIRLGPYADIDVGEGVEVELVNFDMGFVFPWDVLDEYWTIARGVSLETAQALGVAAEEYIALRESEVLAGVRLSAGAHVPLFPISFGADAIVSASVDLQVNPGYTWTFAVEQKLSTDQFLEATGQFTLAAAVWDVFTPYGDHWWEKLFTAAPVSIGTGLDLLGLADFNNSPIQLLNDGDRPPQVRVTQSASTSIGLGVKVGIGSPGAVGVSAGVAGSFGAEVAASASVVTDPGIKDPEPHPAVSGIPYTAHARDADGSIDSATGIGFGTTYTGAVDPAGDVDWYAFELPTSDTIGVTFHEVGGLDAELMLYDHTGARQAWSHGSSFTVDLPAGEYRIAVSSYGSHATGRYALRLSQLEQGNKVAKSCETWDDRRGDDDGVMEAGEGVGLKVQLISSEAIEDVEATLTTGDPRIYIREPRVFYDRFSAGQMQWCIGSF